MFIPLLDRPSEIGMFKFDRVSAGESKINNLVPRGGFSVTSMLAKRICLRVIQKIEIGLKVEETFYTQNKEKGP